MEEEMKESKKETGALSRRGFLQGTVVAAAGAAAVGLVGCDTPAAGANEPAITWDEEYDVVVAGAGHGGMTAAVAAADGGAKVLLIEISSVTGGSTLFSGGYIHSWGLRNWQDYNTFVRGLHDPVLAKVFVETFWNEYIPWLETMDVPIHRPLPDGNGPRGYADYAMGTAEDFAQPGKYANRRYFDELERVLTELGGTVKLKTSAVKLFADDKNNIIGLRAKTWTNSPVEEDQEFFNVKAKKVILTTGNFFSNRSMTTQYLSPYGYSMVSCSGPYQRGEGVAMCEEHGAFMSRFADAWSGNICAFHQDTMWEDDPEAYEKFLAETPVEEYTVLGKGFASHTGVTSMNNPPAPFNSDGGSANAILVNLDGERFVDESNSEVSWQRRPMYFVIRQPQGMAWVIGDKDSYDADQYSQDKLDLITRKGGNVMTANTIEELASKMQTEAGVYKFSVIKTITDYNAAIDAGTTAELTPPRTPQETFNKIDNPPFYACAIRTCAYYNFGGLTIDKDAQVLNKQMAPIGNLYAPPPLGGGVMNQQYTGGIGISGTFGFRAGKHAAARI
jgi:succinate dehydrogenase/fumarate reductase flavoprotein subunit